MSTNDVVPSVPPLTYLVRGRAESPPDGRRALRGQPLGVDQGRGKIRCQVSTPRSTGDMVALAGRRFAICTIACQACFGL